MKHIKLYENFDYTQEDYFRDTKSDDEIVFGDVEGVLSNLASYDPNTILAALQPIKQKYNLDEDPRIYIEMNSLKSIITFALKRLLKTGKIDGLTFDTVIAGI